MNPHDATALTIEITGAVQGVGFRPYAYRLATARGLAGAVRNTECGVSIFVEGESGAPWLFLQELQRHLPAHARVDELKPTVSAAQGLTAFTIEPSRIAHGGVPTILPDYAPCAECLREMRDPKSRRFRYPFTNCVHCGPRYSIIKSMPYDRERTSMSRFQMCPECAREYGEVADRRFHAQPIACPVCGPDLQVLSPEGAELAHGTEACLALAAQALKAGLIVALKGVGGFQLLADAANEEAVARLRLRKGRDAKPFAVMAGSLAGAEKLGDLNEEERRLLSSPAAPIVLVQKKPDCHLAPSVCTFSRYVGVMLPASALHALLMDDLGRPVVATSGNISGEPLCATTAHALKRLGRVADVFLTHNRSIVRPVDDSVAQVVCGRTLMRRCARGYAPCAVWRGDDGTPDVLALGSGLKNTVCFLKNGQAVMSPHIGDLDSAAGVDACERTIDMMGQVLGRQQAVLAADAHPDGPTVRMAGRLVKNTGGREHILTVQHHRAHVWACALENSTPMPALGIAWDGTGYGDDGTIWGGEFFRMQQGYSADRVGRLRPFMLVGGELAVRDPGRVACALLSQMKDSEAPELLARLNAGMGRDKCHMLKAQMRAGINTPLTSSMGRLFDGMAFWCGFNGIQGCEGHAACMLENWAADAAGKQPGESYRWHMDDRDGLLELDWRPVLKAVNVDVAMGTPKEWIARKFHESLCRMAYDVATYFKMNTIVLGGGCFQNAFLLEGVMREAQLRRLRLDLPQRVPCNDGGISLGQLVVGNDVKLV